MNDMTLEKKIYADYVSALKSKEKDKAQFLNFIRAGLKYIAIGLKKDSLSDDEVIACLKKNQKQLEETRQSGIDAGKKDITEKAEAELDIIKQYLPEPLDDAQLIDIIDLAIKQINAASVKDMGKVMKEVLAKAGAGVDAKKASALVKDRLSSV